MYVSILAKTVQDLYFIEYCMISCCSINCANTREVSKRTFSQTNKNSPYYVSSHDATT
jgi:hypothetical protein